VVKPDFPDPRPDISEAMVRAMHARAIELSLQPEENWLELGRMLDEMHRDKLYRKIGYRFWRGYVQTSGLKIKERSCYNLMEIVRSPHIEKIQHLPYTIGLQVKDLSEDELDATLAQIQNLNEKDRWMVVTQKAGNEVYVQKLLKRKKALEAELKKIDKELENFLPGNS
jgi:hypothetical protein